MTFAAKLTASWAKNNSLLCVGLDPDLEKLPTHLRSEAEPLFAFNKAIIDATADVVCAFKPNSAFYEASGAEGIIQLEKTCRYIRENYPEIPVLLDCKRGDIGNTNNYYARFAFEYLGVDGITINPYMGRDANQAFLDYKDKGIIVLCRTSNLGTGFQDLNFEGKPLYRLVAEQVMSEWNENRNCALVIGATYPVELAEIRKLLGDAALFLIPGVGTQGGSVEETVRAGVNMNGTGVIISSSRAIIFASAGEDFADAARATAIQTRDEINKYRS